MTLLAHEVGHIVTGATPLPPGVVNWSDESRADHFAGWTVARLGFNPIQLARGQRMFREQFAASSNRHPDGLTRSSLLDLGFRTGFATRPMVMTAFVPTTPPVIVPRPLYP